MDKRQQFVRAVADLAASLYDFHERWGFGSFNPRDLRDVFAERYRILDEEILEFRIEIDADHRRRAAEEIADVLFAALGDAELLTDDAITALHIVAAKNRAKTMKTHAVAPSGKLLPLADDKAAKWAGMEDARAAAIERDGKQCRHEYRYYPTDREKWCHKCRLTFAMVAQDAGRPDDYR